MATNPPLHDRRAREVPYRIVKAILFEFAVASTAHGDEKAIVHQIFVGAVVHLGCRVVTEVAFTFGCAHHTVAHRAPLWGA